MTITEAISAPVRYQFQAVTYEGPRRAVNATRMMCMDEVVPIPKPGRPSSMFPEPIGGWIPRRGQPLILGDELPWEAQVVDVVWDVAESRFIVSCDAKITRGVTAKQVEEKLKAIGWREDIEAACWQEIVDEPSSQGLDSRGICRLRDERLELLGLLEKAEPVEKHGWCNVRFLIHECLYCEETEQLLAEIPPLQFDSQMPCWPAQGLPADRTVIRISEHVDNLFEVASLSPVAVPGFLLVKLSPLAPISDYSKAEKDLRAAGFIDVPNAD